MSDHEFKARVQRVLDRLELERRRKRQAKARRNRERKSTF